MQVKKAFNDRGILMDSAPAPTLVSAGSSPSASTSTTQPLLECLNSLRQEAEKITIEQEIGR